MITSKQHTDIKNYIDISYRFMAPCNIAQLQPKIQHTLMYRKIFISSTMATLQYSQAVDAYIYYCIHACVNFKANWLSQQTSHEKLNIFYSAAKISAPVTRRLANTLHQHNYVSVLTKQTLSINVWSITFILMSCPICHVGNHISVYANSKESFNNFYKI